MPEDDDRLYTGVQMGQSVYDEAGESLGVVRGVDADGFYVLAPEGAREHPIVEVRELTGRDYVMWRCWQCGAMGQIEDSLPDACPDCGARREELYYWAED
jgi:Zn finger protein HypA/HybF involved in hydrogenase expression